MILVIWCACCFVVGFVAVLAAGLACAYAWKLFTSALHRMWGDS